MVVTVTQASARVPVTVLHIKGDVDGASYEELIDKARELTQSGPLNIVLDFGGVPFLSSAGLMALYSIAQMARGLPQPGPDDGWENFRSVAREGGSDKQQHLKLLNVSAKVNKVLVMTGFDRFFEFYTDQQAAVASF